jgi:hypothetical protein
MPMRSLRGAGLEHAGVLSAMLSAVLGAC